MNTNTEIFLSRPEDLEHIQITREEVKTFWHAWLQRKHDHLGLATMKRIREQGDHLIQNEHPYWADHSMVHLYNQALDRVETYWNHK